MSPLPKTGSLADVGNWLPICLLNLCNKLTEKVIHRQLLEHLVRENLISEKQAGFMPGRSTGDAVYHLLSDLYTARNTSQRSAVVFLDMRKAFDTVDHLILLDKLAALNLEDNFLEWLRHYLGGRRQQTRANNIVSDTESVERGVPQGSVVGPLLFIIYVNDVCKIIKNAKYYRYADDIALVVSCKDVNRACALMQDDLDRIGFWCGQNKLTINASKTQVLWSFSPRSIPNLVGVDLRLNGETLKVVSQFNYLGVIVDCHLRMSQHLKKVISMVQSKLPQLRRIRAGSDQKTAVEVYTHMISIMEYCSFTYGGGPVWAINKLQTLQI